MPTGHTSRRGSRTRSASGCSRSWSSSRQPAPPPPTTWPRRSKRLFLSIRTLRSSSAFPASASRSVPGVLAEIGDDRTRFADARGLKAYAGASPITRASGKKSSITRRWVKNDRLNHAGYLWAFSAITTSPGAKTHYRRRRDNHGDWHAAAQRNLFNRMLGQL
ncbi:transposase, partial [Streptomyces sp. bgisy027]|uniref:transposase n=1 Tax=Streptomyces sp. bgisy027 TaxID=3413770 RepID=UPI003D73921F